MLGPESSQFHTAAAAPSEAFDAQALFEQHKSSVVNLAVKESFGPNIINKTIGSGFVIESNAAESICRIATDDHVVSAGGGAPTIVTFDDKKSLVAKIELRDPANDLAVLRIDGVTNTDEQCKSLKLSDKSEPAPVGADVLKLTSRMGTPDYSAGKVAEYFVRDLAEGIKLLPGENPKRNVMLINGHGDGGDSGGPIINRQGVAVAIDDMSGPGIIGATPSHYLKSHLDKLQDK